MMYMRMRISRYLILIVTSMLICFYLIGCIPSYEEELTTVLNQAIVTNALLSTSSDCYLPTELSLHEIQKETQFFPLAEAGVKSAYIEGDSKIVTDSDSLTTVYMIDTSKYEGSKLLDLDTEGLLRLNELYAGNKSNVVPTIDPNSELNIKLVVTHTYEGPGGWRVMTKWTELKEKVELAKVNVIDAFDYYFMYPFYSCSPLLDPYCKVYRKLWEHPVLPDVSYVKANGTKWVFKEGLDAVWISLMHVVSQYHGILSISNQDDFKAVIFRRILPVSNAQNTDEHKSPYSLITKPSYVVIVMTIVAVKENDNTTAVYCVPLNIDGLAAKFEDTATFSVPVDKTNSAGVDADNYSECLDITCEKSKALLQDKPVSNEKSRIKKSSPISDEYLLKQAQAAGIIRFYRELAIQIYAPKIWEQKYREPYIIINANAVGGGNKTLSMLEEFSHSTKLQKNMDYYDANLIQLSVSVVRDCIQGLSVQVVSPTVEKTIKDTVKNLQKPLYKTNPEIMKELKQDFVVFLIASPDIQAFSLPDGTIFLSSGLLDKLNNSNELAAVLAHQMAHVVCKDTNLVFNRNKKTSDVDNLPSLKVLPVNQALAEASVESAVVNLNSLPLDCFKAAAINGYSKEAELRADGFAVALLIAAGYDRQAMASLLQTLQNYKVNAQNTGSVCYSRLQSSLINSQPGLEERLISVNQLLAKYDGITK